MFAVSATRIDMIEHRVEQLSPELAAWSASWWGACSAAGVILASGGVGSLFRNHSGLLKHNIEPSAGAKLSSQEYIRRSLGAYLSPGLPGGQKPSPAQGIC